MASKITTCVLTLLFLAASPACVGRPSDEENSTEGVSPSAPTEASGSASTSPPSAQEGDPDLEPVSSLPLVDVARRRSYYRVHGSTVAELRSAMDNAGPGFDARTTWFVTWRYDYLIAGGSCGVGPIDVDLKVKMLLPRWLPPPDATEELRRDWTDYKHALLRHERGHADNGASAANRIVRMLRDSRGFGSCPALERHLDDAGKQILEVFQRRDVAYDKRTNHGATQGATFG